MQLMLLILWVIHHQWSWILHTLIWILFHVKTNQNVQFQHPISLFFASFPSMSWGNRESKITEPDDHRENLREEQFTLPETFFLDGWNTSFKWGYITPSNYEFTPEMDGWNMSVSFWGQKRPIFSCENATFVFFRELFFLIYMSQHMLPNMWKTQVPTKVELGPADLRSSGLGKFHTSSGFLTCQPGAVWGIRSEILMAKNTPKLLYGGFLK